MTVKEFSNLFKEKETEVADLFARVLPVKLGNMAKEHFKDNFRKGGFVDNSLEVWPKAKRQSGSSADSSYGPLLSGRNRLASSIDFRPITAGFIVFTPIAYARIHNEGGETNPSVTPKMRRFAWAKYYEATKITKSMDKDQKKSLAKSAGENALMWQRLALTKKTTLKVRIPQRKFLAPSSELNKAMNTKMELEIKQIMNSRLNGI